MNMAFPTLAQSEAAEPPSEESESDESSLEFEPDYSDVWEVGETTTATPLELEEIYVPRTGVLDVPGLERPLDQFVEWTTQLEEETGLRLGIAYTMIFQGATGGSGTRNGGSGDLDLFGSWTLLGRGTKDTGQLVFSGEYRHKIGPIPASDLGGEIGTLQRTTNGFNDRGWVVRDVYWLQRLFDDKFGFLLGRADPSDFFGSHRMQNLNSSFSNRAFSANSVVPSPGHGITGGVSIRPTDLFFVTSGLSNAYGRSNINDISTLDEGDFFSFAEFGLTPTIKNLGPGRYRLLVWHIDARDDLDIPSDQGFSIVLDQDLDERWLVFARYGFADEGISGIKSSFEAGVGVRGLLGSAANMTGLGFAYSEPTSDAGRDEKIFEAFHRWQLTRHTQLSIGAQAIIDPSFSDSDVVGVFTTRFRIAF